MINHDIEREKFRQENGAGNGTQPVFGVPSYGHRIESNGQLLCGCYPECRYDCPDSQTCYESMPEYWTKQYRAQRYAADVLKRRPDVRAWLDGVLAGG